MSGSAASARSAAVDPRRRSPRVVVGVDGSPGARAALAHALIAAARQGAGLHVVSTYSVQAVWIGGYPLGVPAGDTIRDEAEARVLALVDEARDDLAVRAEPGTADVATDVTVCRRPDPVGGGRRTARGRQPCFR
jgi:nucleotide-binding universal stress UspA family protein